MTSASPDNLLTVEQTLRGAPWSQEAEQAVLGAMILDQDAALRAVESLDHSMFYRESHRRLFRALVALTEQRVVVDHITLRDELVRRGDLEAVGGMEYLAEVVDAVATAANLDHHVRIVKDKAILRRLIEASTQTITEAYDAKLSSGELVDQAEGRIFKISQERKQDGFTRSKRCCGRRWSASKRSRRAAKRLPGCRAASQIWTS